ncbi:alpha/beta fold hydrolase [Metabacillus sp. JX24]|uniref:alpha/beta fold hydrolase n=1 Tax=Metabacillus sp. JX24 TaxID=3240759 RepID=UPI00350FE5C2
MKTKWKKIIRTLFLLIGAVILLSFILHQGITFYEQKKYQAPGQLVKVDGRSMHVYTKGEGKHTILLLSGLGTAAPVLDFEPLVNELAKNHKVVVAEPFGYGWSDGTNKARTVENMVEEVRTALKKAGIQGPYVLMPHSVSGVYSMYYANAYPDEIEAIIGIDPTQPKAFDFFNEKAPSVPSFVRAASVLGAARWAAAFTPEDFLPIAEEETYSEENKSMTKRITAWKSYHKNVIDEANELSRSAEKTEDMTFPPHIPVMIFQAEDKDQKAKDEKIKTFYLDQMSHAQEHKLVSLAGHHYLHWTKSAEISEYTAEFLKK